MQPQPDPTEVRVLELLGEMDPELLAAARHAQRPRRPGGRIPRRGCPGGGVRALAPLEGFHRRVGAGSAATKRFEVTKWNAVAFWSWDVEQDRCAICRNSTYEPSIESQAQGVTVSERRFAVGAARPREPAALCRR